MDALSSLKFAMPVDPTAQLMGAVKDLSPAKSISLPELQTLNSDTATRPLDNTQPSYSFQNLLGDFVNDVSAKQAAAGDAVNGLLSGKNVPLHQAMISMEEASVSFSMMVEVRNKLLDSYQELMRMQV
jgi:flagellar hook-basal body complex protein FliE